MSRKTAYLQSAGRYFHAYNRGVNREPIFLTDEDYRIFIRQIRESTSCIGVVLLNYCLMPNHYHFTLRQDLPYAMATFFQLLCDRYAKTFNFLHGRVGHLFQGSYTPKPVDNLETLSQLSRYIHMNPVAARLVSDPNQWEFSSCQEYCGLRSSGFVEPAAILERFGDGLPYTAYLRQNAPEDQMQFDHMKDRRSSVPHQVIQ
jgi:putative transposase